MKRTKDINRDRFRKVRKFHYKPLLSVGVVTVVAMLMGCDGKTYSETPYSSVDECYSRGQFTHDQCRRLQQESQRDAQSNGTRFRSKEECLRDNPQNDCQTAHSGSHFFYYSQPRYFSYNNDTGHAAALYRSPVSHGFTTSRGNSFTPRTTTTTRGGFGASVSRSFSSHSSGG